MLLAVPLALSRFRRDCELRFAVQHVETQRFFKADIGFQLGSRNVSAETNRAVLLDAPPIGPREYEHAVVGRSQAVAAFVHEAMMKPAQRDEIA